jgi:hypothetical protein
MTSPLCFVLMPFGRKPDPNGGPDLDFDGLFERAIRPAIAEAGMEPVRADQESTFGVIHKAMFERLMLCDFAVADLTTLNANVFYELGVRHAVRPATTLPIYHKVQRLPFDVNLIRALPYELGEKNALTEAHAQSLRQALGARLAELRRLGLQLAPADSPVFQLLKDYRAPEIAHLQTDTFRERTRYSQEQKVRLADLRRRQDLDGLRRFDQEIGSLDAADAGVVVDLFLSYRALEAYEDMVQMVQRLPETLRRVRMVREQWALAENRRGRPDSAQRILQELHRDEPETSESRSILGRVYKDLWIEHRARGSEAAGGYLDHAIKAYVAGFESDWRDAYPGVNAVTLLSIRGSEDDLALRTRLSPVVRFSVEQRLRGRDPAYWDYASLLELDVVEGDAESAKKLLPKLSASVREPWELESTLRNLALYRDALAARGTGAKWLRDLIEELGKGKR